MRSSPADVGPRRQQVPNSVGSPADISVSSTAIVNVSPAIDVLMATIETKSGLVLVTFMGGAMNNTSGTTQAVAVDVYVDGVIIPDARAGNYQTANGVTAGLPQFSRPVRVKPGIRRVSIRSASGDGTASVQFSGATNAMSLQLLEL